MAEGALLMLVGASCFLFGTNLVVLLSGEEKDGS